MQAGSVFSRQPRDVLHVDGRRTAPGSDESLAEPSRHCLGIATGVTAPPPSAHSEKRRGNRPGELPPALPPGPARPSRD
jgi:hypothetical protein